MAGLKLLTEACQQVSGAVGPGSPAAPGAFWPGSRSPHSAEPGTRGGAQRADPESPSAPKIKAPILTKGQAILPGGDPWPRKRGNLPAGEVPGECLKAGAPQVEAPRLLQRDWPGDSLSTCKEERKGWLPGFLTGFKELKLKGELKEERGQEGSGTGTGLVEQWPRDR